MTHDPREAIADELRRSIGGDAWHGSSLLVTLQGVDAGVAAARPIAAAHSIWEIALHAAGWMREVARRLDGGAPGEPAGGDWPSARKGEAAWRAAIADIHAAGDELLRALGRFPAERLDETVGGPRDPALGAGVSYRVTLHGAAQHNAYHGGQISLLRRALGA
jgi:hypothetical protein